MSLRLGGFYLTASTALDSPTCPVSTFLQSSLVIPTDFTSAYPVPTAFSETLVVPTDVKACNVTKPYGQTNQVKLYVPQGADRTFAFTDVDAATDFSGLSAATFDVWDSITAGSTNQITKALASGVVIAADDQINVTLTDTDTNISAGTYHFELWITTSGGDKYLLKYGSFIVEDTRKFD